MPTIVEWGVMLAAVATAFTYCCVKCTAQLEQSRCNEIRVCSTCILITRQLEVEAAAIDVDRPGTTELPIAGQAGELPRYHYHHPQQLQRVAAYFCYNR